MTYTAYDRYNPISDEPLQKFKGGQIDPHPSVMEYFRDLIMDGTTIIAEDRRKLVGHMVTHVTKR